MSQLPKQFETLTPLVTEWVLDTEAQRNYKRRSSSMESLREFYNAMLPSMEDLADYLQPLPLDDLPKEAKTLFDLALMFMEISLSIENFHSPDVPGGFDPERFHILPAYAQTAAGTRQ